MKATPWRIIHALNQAKRGKLKHPLAKSQAGYSHKTKPPVTLPKIELKYAEEMSIGEKWLMTLDPKVPWSVAYKKVEELALWRLAAKPEKSYSTTELAFGIWPQQEGVPGREEEVRKARERLFKALNACANHGLSHCVSYVEDILYGRTVQRKIWQYAKSEEELLIESL